MNKKLVVPNFFTACSLMCGLLVIFKMGMLSSQDVQYHHILKAVLIVLVSALLDLIDGLVARAIRAESSFGCMFDSMADGIAFGVAPAMIMLKAIHLPVGTMLSYIAVVAAMVYACSGILRLVRFTVTSFQPPKGEVGDKSFVGLPIPAAALCLLSLTLLLSSQEFKELMPLQPSEEAWILISAAVFLGYFMISRWKFPSAKKLSFAVSSFLVLLLTVIVSVVIIEQLFFCFPFVGVLLSWSYFTVSLVLSVVRWILGKRVKSLEDFDSDSEDI